MTSEKVERYKELLQKWVAPGFQESGSEESENVGSELDELWYSMSAEELDEVDPHGAEARKSSGKGEIKG